MTTSLMLAALLPVIPQPTEWKPAEGTCDLAGAKVVEKIVTDASLGDEGYRMYIRPGTIEIVADAKTGLLWGRQTLEQLKNAGAKAECGEIFDKPKYRVRGFMMDVGRMYHSMDFLRDLARTMAYYKMNTLHIHLNDCEIEKNPNADWSKKQAAFRLESEVYPGLTAKDGHYTKKEFREFMLYCKSLGITVIPEIDVPAHSLAFTRFKPEFASKKYGADHFDLDKTDEIIAWLKPLFAEYMTGAEPTFIGPYMHVGTDEYNRAEAEKFRKFTDEMFKMVEGFGYKVCAWGALTHASGKTPVRAHRDITIDIWHNPYYQPKDAIDAGYTVVSIPDGLVYLVPFAGYYYDYLNCRYLYEHWEPRNIGNYTVPDDKLDQLAGGKFALWNDALGRKVKVAGKPPYTEADNWDRIYPALQTLGQKFWSGARADQPWDKFAPLANSKPEPKGVKFSRTFRLRK
ncbi:MAG: family 20 glycosylhydrolase [Kiritimatiellae bacterium]|nr:family 20 glycosylhydrolase [Kiritimatiellia bacterium]